MALNPALYLQINNSKVAGFNSQLKNDGSIECLSFHFGASTPVDWATGSFTGRREHVALTITKRIDSASPLIWQALVTNQVVAGKIKFFRPPADGGSKDENFYTVEFSNGRVASVFQSVNHVASGKDHKATDTKETTGHKGGGEHPYDTVSFAYKTMSVTYNSKDAQGVQASDDWSDSSS